MSGADVTKCDLEYEDDESDYDPDFEMADKDTEDVEADSHVKVSGESIAWPRLLTA